MFIGAIKLQIMKFQWTLNLDKNRFVSIQKKKFRNSINLSISMLITKVMSAIVIWMMKQSILDIRKFLLLIKSNYIPIMVLFSNTVNILYLKNLLWITLLDYFQDPMYI